MAKVSTWECLEQNAILKNFKRIIPDLIKEAPHVTDITVPVFHNKINDGCTSHKGRTWVGRGSCGYTTLRWRLNASCRTRAGNVRAYGEQAAGEGEICNTYRVSNISSTSNACKFITEVSIHICSSCYHSCACVDRYLCACYHCWQSCTKINCMTAIYDFDLRANLDAGRIGDGNTAR